MKNQLRNRQRETAQEILEGPIPATVTLPEAPSIEFVTPRRIFLKAIWTRYELPEFKHRGCRRVAVLETPEGNRIALLDEPEDRSRYFRYDNPHHRDPVCETILRTDLALGVDLKRWRRDPLLVPAATNPDGIQAIIDQCRWVYPHIPWPLDWVRYTLDHCGYREAERQKLQERGWALDQAGRVLDSSTNYPLYVILETQEGLYQPVEREIMFTGLTTDSYLPRLGERTFRWRGRAATSWPDAVSQLFRHYGWTTQAHRDSFRGRRPPALPQGGGTPLGRNPQDEQEGPVAERRRPTPTRYTTTGYTPGGYTLSDGFGRGDGVGH